MLVFVYHTELKKEEVIQRKKAEETRQMKMRIEDHKQTSLNDLTKGVLRYKKLGIDIEAKHGFTK